MHPTLEMKPSFSFSILLDNVLEKILDVADYMIYKKHITLSEGVLFAQTASRGIWYAIFGVTGGIYGSIFPSHIWVGIFAGLAIAKLLSYFLADNRLRSITVIGSALLWTFLTILAVVSGSTDPVAPTFAIFALLSLIIVVRLIRDKPNAG